MVDHQLSQVGRYSQAELSTGMTGAIFLIKWAIPGLFFIYFCLFKQTLQFLQQIYVKNVHPVYGAGIRTDNFQNISLHL